MERTNKKQRLCDAKPPGDGDGEIPLSVARTTSSSATAVPPEIWARILEYSVFSDVACMTLVSKSFLNDVLPLVRFLYLDNNVCTSQWHRPITLSLLKKMVIDCLLCFLGKYNHGSVYDTFKVKRSWEDEGRSVVGDVLACLPKLKNVFLGTGTGESKKDILDRLQLVEGPETGEYSYHHYRDITSGSGWLALSPDSLGDGVLYRNMLISLCGAYSNGRLSEDLAIHGLPADHHKIEPRCDCNMCKMICRTFPLNQVAVLKQPVWDEPYFPRRLGNVPVDTRVNFVAQRPGGLELLKYKQTHFFRELLEYIVFTSLVEDADECVITHESSVLGAMRALKSLGCVPEDVPHSVVMEALSRVPNCSFWDPPKCRRIKKSDFLALVELGFSLNEWDVTIVPDHLCSDD